MIRASRLKLCIAAVASSLIFGCSDQAIEQADLSLYFTGTVNGYIEPCGCVAGQIGGIDRIAGFIEDGLEANPNSLFVETGDFISEDYLLDEAVLRQLPLKAEAFFSAWSRLGCAAMAVGENDLLTLGVDTLKKLSAKYDIPLLCGNLTDKAGEQVFESYVIVERNGKRIGIFSLLAPELDQPIAHDAEMVDVAGLLRPQGLRFENWSARAKEIVEELQPQTDLILCASHLGFNLNRKLAKAFPQVDVVFGGHFGEAKKDRYFVGKTPVLVSLVRGARVGRVDWWWPEPDKFFAAEGKRETEGNGRLLDVSSRLEIKNDYEVATSEYNAIQKRKKAHTDEMYDLLYQDKVALINGAERLFQQLPEEPTVNRFSFVQIPMHRALRRDEHTLAGIDDYHDKLNELWTVKQPKNNREQVERYIGPEACERCHPNQYEFWKATRHSFALRALEATKQEVDPECFYCHTVGYRLEGGFHRPGRQAGYENVQCAACHGPGADHVSGGTSYFNPELFSPSGADSCAQCHNKIHDPNFEMSKARKLPLVACPPLEPVARRSLDMVNAAAQAAQAYVNERSPRWPETIYAYRMAGLNDDALKVAEGWLIDRPRSKEAHLAVGLQLLEAGRLEESVRHFEFTTRKAPGDVRGWSGLARAIMSVEPERALEAAKEALSLEQGNPSHIRTMAQILIGEGRIGAAAGVVRGFTEIFPQYIPLFVDLFEGLELETAPESE